MIYHKIKLCVLAGILLFSIIVFPAQALVSTSTNFTIEDSVIGGFGGISTSTSFGLDSSGGDTATGESASDSFDIKAGSKYKKEYIPKSQNWRWYDDEENETPASPLAGENTAPADIANQEVAKLRLTIKETGGDDGKDIKFKIQFSEHSDFSQDVYDAVEIGDCAATSTWCYADGGGIDNEIITTKLLSDADSCSGGVGKGCGTHNESGVSISTFKHKKSTATEFEFTIRQAGAKTNIVYFFRAYDTTNNKAVPLAEGKNYPSLSTQGTFLVFNVSGLPSGTATEGIVTDIGTTPSDISFDIIELNQEKEAAQRLEVQTNAKEGYQIFMFQRQGLLGPAEINPVTGTNEVPLSWILGCATVATGCYGYHAGDDSLAGGSVRFSPNDSYAKLETLPKEVAYSSVPVVSESTDIIFKIKVSLNQQPGNYNSSVVYIIVPTF